MATYTEKFNFYLKTFLGELQNIFPEFKESISSSYSEVLESESLSVDTYVKEYMSAVESFHNQIATKQNSLFLGDNELKFLRELDFRELWTKDLSDSTRENIWKYLQTLYVIGKKIVANDDDVNVMLNELNTPSQEDFKQHQQEMMEMIENMSKITDENRATNSEVENLFNNGIISDIAKELTTELDLDKMDMGNPQNMNEAFSNIMGGGGGTNFFNLISKVGEKIQSKVESGQINQGDLINEAQKMMGGLKNPQQMAQNMRANKGKEATRDRLRRKLEEKRAKEAAAQNQ